MTIAGHRQFIYNEAAMPGARIIAHVDKVVNFNSISNKLAENTPVMIDDFI